MNGAARGTMSNIDSNKSVSRDDVAGSSTTTETAFSRRGAIRRALLSSAVASWLTVGTGTRVATASAVAGGGRGSGGGAEEGDGFGSKAFTRRSYDGFAEGYDDLDGGWAASVIGMEVCLVVPCV